MENETEPLGQLPDPIYELSEKLRERKINGLRFCQKLFLALETSLQYPQFINFIGVKWLDESAFACNVEIFARIIHIKRNSINKQFSQFHFDKLTSKDFAFLIDQLPNARNWVPRRCKTPTFRQSATLNEVGQIENKEYIGNIHYEGPIEISVKADSFIRTLHNANAVKALFDEAGKNIEDIETAIDEWTIICSDCNNDLSLDNVVSSIVLRSEVEVLPIAPAFIKVLLQNNIYSSVVIKDVSFLEYYRLFLRFGRLSRIAFNISSLIDVERKSFYEWFLPTCDTTPNTTNMFLLYVRLSNSSPNSFTLVTETYTKKIVCRPRAPLEEMFVSDPYKSFSIPQLLVNMGIIEPKPTEGESGWTFSAFSQSFSQNPDASADNENATESFVPF